MTLYTCLPHGELLPGPAMAGSLEAQSEATGSWAEGQKLGAQRQLRTPAWQLPGLGRRTSEQRSEPFSSRKRVPPVT